MLMLLACTAPTPDSAPLPTAPLGQGFTVETQENLPEALVPEERWYPAPLSPTACPEPIYEPQPGNLPSPPILAEPSSEVLGSEPFPRYLHLGMGSSESLIVLWATDEATKASEVELSLEDGSQFVISGSSFTLVDDPLLRRVHEVRVCGLPGGTKLKYRAGGAGTWSDQVEVKMPGEELVAVAVGDTRGDPTTWGMILGAAEALDPDLILFTGDMVPIGRELDDWWQWLQAGEGILDHRILLSTHGNHEGLAQAYFGLLGLPGNEQWFSLDFPAGHLSFFNDSGLSTEVDDQVSWLTQDLADARAPWKITIHHQPAFSSSQVHAVSATVRYQFVPVMEAGGVKLDLAGHNHHYERMLPLHDGLFTLGGTIYVVTAGGGAPLYPNLGDQPTSAAVAVAEHYTVLRISPSQIRGQAIDLAGNILDQFELQQ